MTALPAGRLPSTADGGADRVIGEIERLVPAWYGPDARLKGRPPVRHRPWSVHFLPTVETPDGEIDLIVKIPLWGEAPDLPHALEAGPQEATRAEFAMLGRIEAMAVESGAPALTWVRRVAYVEEINAVVTERLASRTLRETPGARRPEAAHAVGVWLRRFHDEIGAAADGVLEPCDFPDLDDLEGAAGHLSGALRSAVGGVRRTAEELMGRPVRRATTHGDLGPSNVLVTPEGRVAVIDPNLVPAPVEADLAKLAVAVRTPRYRLLSGMPFGGEPHPVERAVLDGYGMVSGEVYDLCRRLGAIRRWIEVETESRGVRRLVLPAARRVLAAESG